MWVGVEVAFEVAINQPAGDSADLKESLLT
jgi:hypothetical protein